MLSEVSKQKIGKELAKYPDNQRQSAVMSALAIAQDQMGWLSADALRAVADYIGMPPIAVQEVATFYNMYDVTPVGRHKITVCTNLPCELNKGCQAAEHLKQVLGIEFNQTTADGQFTLKEGECMGACGDAPVLLVNNKTMHSFMSNDKIDQLIHSLSSQ